MSEEQRLYQQRNYHEQEPYFSRHMDHMTGEDLNGKAEIAGELAYRDMVISDLLEALEYANRFLRPQDVDKEYIEAAIAKARGES